VKVGWLCDDPGYIGGAELTQAEFRAAAPGHVEIVDCPPGEVVAGLERYVVHNCVHYSPADIAATRGGKVVRYIHDVWPHGDPEVRSHILNTATLIFCSPLHRDRFPHKFNPHALTIPPALDLPSFKPSRQTKRHREGNCSIAQWRASSKGAHLLAEWAKANGEVDVYGPGIKAVGNLHPQGPVDPSLIAQTLWRYHRFVFLPSGLEPFCRTVAEAWAAGCEVVTNRLVGALHWIENEPEKLESAAADFWEVVENP
jgi:glycosyltransferase involved in cell wall biosynthesis